MPRFGVAHATACKIQKRLLSWLMVDETEPAAAAQLARAWDTLEERKRILRGVPKVQAISVREMQQLKASRATKLLRSTSLFEEPNKKESLQPMDPSGHPPGQGEPAPSSSGVGTPPAIDISNHVDRVSGSHLSNPVDQSAAGVSASPKYAKPWKWKSKAASSVAGECCQPTSESGHVTDLASSVDQVSSAEELLAELKAAGMNLEEPVPEVDGEQPQE